MLKNRLQKIRHTSHKIVALLLVISFLTVFHYGEAYKGEGDGTAVSGNGTGYVCNFLLLGVDSTERLTDVIMLVSLNSTSRSLSVAQVPRDTYAEYTDAAYRKLNGAYSTLGGGREVADFLEKILGITIDHYIVLDLEVLSETVDAVGGVEITVPEDMTYFDEAQGLSIDLKAGNQLLDGDKAVQFIRYRAGYVRGDIARLDAQKIFLSAFFERLASCPKPKLITVAQKLIANSKNDISLEDCFDIISNAIKIEEKNIIFFTMPGADVRTDGGAWYYVINKKETVEMLERCFGGSGKISETDSGRALTGVYSKEFNAIYDAESGYECKIYTAESINSGGIEIDKIKQ